MKIDDEEYFKGYDEESDKEYSVKFCELAVRRTKYCFILNNVSKDENDYIDTLSRRFDILDRNLKLQLGFSILNLFVKSDLTDYIIETDQDAKNEHYEIVKSRPISSVV